MIYQYYQTPAAFDDLLLTSDGRALTGLTFLHTPAQTPLPSAPSTSCSVFEDAVKWLDSYFAGKVPCYTPAF